MTRAHVISAALVALGLLQMGADAAGLPTLRALANATAASPAPKVFTAVQGSEPFATRFVLHYTDTHGIERAVALTPERYARMRGPYNRRNAYGAVLAAGPALAVEPLLSPAADAIARFALCGDAPILREIGVDPATVAGSIRIQHIRKPTAPAPELSDWFEVSCR